MPVELRVPGPRDCGIALGWHGLGRPPTALSWVETLADLLLSGF